MQSSDVVVPVFTGVFLYLAYLRWDDRAFVVQTWRSCRPRIVAEAGMNALGAYVLWIALINFTPLKQDFYTLLAAKHTAAVGVASQSGWPLWVRIIFAILLMASLVYDLPFTARHASTLFSNEEDSWRPKMLRVAVVSVCGIVAMVPVAMVIVFAMLYLSVQYYFHDAFRKFKSSMSYANAQRAAIEVGTAYQCVLIILFFCALMLSIKIA